MATTHRPGNVHINWRAYTTRRVLLVTGLSVFGYMLEHFAHWYMAGKGGELLIGAVLGHCLLEVE